MAGARPAGGATREPPAQLVARLAVYPEYARRSGRWADPEVAPAARRAADAMGLAREDGWAPGRVPDAAAAAAPAPWPVRTRTRSPCRRRWPRWQRWRRARRGRRGDAFPRTGRRPARRVYGGRRPQARGLWRRVSYVVTRNIQYTNVCYFRCGFCAFSKGRLADNLRGKPYLVPAEEIVRRAREAWERGASRSAFRAASIPAFDGDYYASSGRGARREAARTARARFLGARGQARRGTLGVSLEDYSSRLRRLGLSSLPGTAAEILDDEVRRVICPDKIDTRDWLEVIDTAHRSGCGPLRPSCSAMWMATNWARHLVRVRDLQNRRGGFTEFVPLPFVHMEAPLWRAGPRTSRARPSARPCSACRRRMALHPPSSTPGVLGQAGPGRCSRRLRAGVIDLGGTLMNESISRAAGSANGQEMPPERLEALIGSAGRLPRQRTTLYGEPPAEQVARSFGAPALSPPRDQPAREAGLKAPRRLVRHELALAPER